MPADVVFLCRHLSAFARAFLDDELAIQVGLVLGCYVKDIYVGSSHITHNVHTAINRVYS